jgi:hypothetical protein
VRLALVFTVASTLALACGAEVAATPDAPDAGAVLDAAAAPDAQAPDDAGPSPDGGPTDAQPDRSDPLFTRDRAIRVDIDLAPADWDALRAQTRSLESTLLRDQCLESPFVSPFTYFPARVRIDGVEHARVGVRKKGFLGSLSTSKPSLKIKLDEYVAGAEQLGLSTLTLNNGVQDASQIRPCLGLDAMRAAGVPTPRCGYAEVWVNGEPMGAYVHVEVVNKRFLRRTLGEDEGQLYEGTVSDFRDGWLATFEQETNDAVPYDRSDLAALTAALTVPDDALLGALEPLVDLDEFLRFWATESLIEHWDGYNGNTNNYYVYRRADGRFVFIPWGVDGILGQRNEPPYSVYAVSALAYRLYLHPEGRARYLTAMATELTRWDGEAVAREVDRAARVVAPIVPAGQGPLVSDATRQLREYVRARESQIQRELDGGGATWGQPLRGPLCFALDPVVASAETRFGTHPSPNLFLAGTGSFTATVAGTRYAGLQVGSSSGFGDNPDDQNDVVVLVAATTAQGPIPVLYLVVRPDLFVPGATLPIDGAAVRGALLVIPRPNAPIEFVGGFFGGEVHVTAGSTTDGDRVAVEVRTQLITAR